ncbi:MULTISPECIES: carbohydrate ABC transporter permease [Bacillaceae]|jgi:putative aldouronate transport system permease protein|uniref:Carbohydrate ABC transporter permease n=1 Tax=Rossellomorea aquimaris TaxID=189382 RepID=A0A5D4U3B1_9BACI|nr:MULTISPECIES: carbohydrate ABC transporter permease [Bacillaceae]KAA0566596.1 carbohydrate ABC transporter permease [Bacillus sp. CH30_1T]MDT9025624.1 carbohydrate ABC transporter permease [Rossellomorea sp. YC4-1]TYS81748.1 carbohydrate ABC transporter permease [Rossellomorea aquimaris]TYS88372.1 carbohydrate ABC transporter permease [Rossellomorea aquimaris]TYS89927.1 carbohydrate ABC transporter permease [Rossellomorea aquimaris]
MYQYTRSDKLILFINKILLGGIVIIVLFPLIYVLLSSVLEPNVLVKKGFLISGSDWTLEGYKRIFEDGTIVKGFINSILYSVGFTLITVSVCIFAGYSLSAEGLVGRKFIMVFFLITMFFNGGLIPTYMVVKDLGMLNTIWAIILPNAINVWFIILARTYFKSIPNELKEAARIDGASEFKIFLNIVFPLSKPIIFVIALYAFIAQWNSYFDAMIYLEDRDLYPLQLVLRSILIQNEVQPGMIADQQAAAELQRISEMIKYSSIVLASLPLIIMYPFFQKYFEKGVMVGSLK